MLMECGWEDSSLSGFKHIHPKQLISGTIRFGVWKIHYSYITARGNQKAADKYALGDEYSWDGIENEFNQYIQSQNEKYPERTLSNVEILDMDFMGYVQLPLE